MHEAQRLAFAGPFLDATDVWYRVSLTYRDQLSVSCNIPIDDPASLLGFFADLALHKNGWQGTKKVISREGQLAITCTYGGSMYRPEVSMEVSLALDIPSFDPYWSAQMRLDIDPQSLEGLAARAKVVFGSATAQSQ